MAGVFDYPTYIVLDVPPPVADEVKEIRRIYDPERAVLSVEVSLSGSCGIGAIAADQEQDFVFRRVDSFAAAIAPFESGFEQIKCFRHTGIYYLTMSNPDKYIDLHRRLVGTGIRFTPNPWPFEPHCTLTLCHAMEEELAQRLILTTPPRSKFILDTLSVYQLPATNMPQLLYQRRLGMPVSREP